MKRFRNGEELIDGEEIAREDLKICGPPIANNIKKLRNRDGLSLEDLVKKTNLLKLKEIEEVKKMITLEEATILARVFNVSIESIIHGDSL